MLQTVRYCDTPDGKRIITAFDRLMIDPVATQRRVLALVQDSKQFIRLQKLEQKLQSRFMFWFKRNQLKKQYSEALAELADTVQEISATNQIHFETRKNEIVISEQKAAELLKLCQKHKFVTVDGKVYRGKVNVEKADNRAN